MSFKDLINSCEAASPYRMPPRAEMREIEVQHARDGRHHEQVALVRLKTPPLRGRPGPVSPG